MHCLPPTFSSPSCSDTEEVCLAASETVLSSNQPATTMATIISSSVVFLMCHPGPPFFFFCPNGTNPNGTRYTRIVCFWGWNWGIIFGHAVIRGRGGGGDSNGKLMDICWLILFIYFCSGRGQPHGADNKQMRLEGRCWPGRVTDLSLSLPLSVCLSLCLSTVSRQSQLLIYISLSLHVGGCLQW